jgi:hypothetical protein
MDVKSRNLNITVVALHQICTGEYKPYPVRNELDEWFMEKYSATYNIDADDYTFSNIEGYTEFYLTWM